MIFSNCFEIMNMSDRSVCEFERNVRFIDKLLLGSFTKKRFKQKTRVSHNTLKFLCDKLCPYLQRNNTHVRDAMNARTCQKKMLDAGGRQRNPSVEHWRRGGFLPLAETTASCPPPFQGNFYRNNYCTSPCRLPHQIHSAGENTGGNFNASSAQGL